MDTIARSHVVIRVILTMSPPRRGVGVEMKARSYDEGPRGKKSYPHRESSSSGGRGGDEGQIL